MTATTETTTTETTATTGTTAAGLQLKRRYTRSDPKGLFPRVTGLPELEYNRLGAFWRPLIDMTDSDVAPTRLQMIRPVCDWLADPAPGRWSWFARIGVAGLRHQVVRHAGLDQYDCREPRGLAPELRTPEWDQLVDAIDRFAELDHYLRTLVVFQLAQLSFCHFAVNLAGAVRPDGDAVHDRYVYEVARIRARCPGQAGPALALFESLATTTKDPLVALASCGQGISHAIRSGNDIELARRFEAYGNAISGLADDWYTYLVRSRFHRAVALVRLAERQFPRMRQELAGAVRFNEQLFPGLAEGTDKMVAVENTRIIIESQIKAAARARGDESAAQVRTLCDRLLAIDPFCLQARLVVGDGLAAIGDHAEAALWYSRAGELGTGAGAVGWFRAAQCYDFIGDRGNALNAMGRLLELDSTAVEAQEYLAGNQHRDIAQSA